MSSDAMSEESSVREGAGYDEAFGSSVEPEDFSSSSRRETSAQSLDGEDKCYAEESEEVEIKVGKEESWLMVEMPLTGRMVTVTRVMMEKDLARGPQQVLEITVPLFFPWSGPSTSFYH